MDELARRVGHEKRKVFAHMARAGGKKQVRAKQQLSWNHVTQLHHAATLA